MKKTCKLAILMVVAGVTFSKLIEERIGGTTFYVQDLTASSDKQTGKNSLICAFMFNPLIFRISK